MREAEFRYYEQGFRNYALKYRNFEFKILNIFTGSHICVNIKIIVAEISWMKPLLVRLFLFAKLSIIDQKDLLLQLIYHNYLFLFGKICCSITCHCRLEPIIEKTKFWNDAKAIFFLLATWWVTLLGRDHGRVVPTKNALQFLSTYNRSALNDIATFMFFDTKHCICYQPRKTIVTGFWVNNTSL